MSEQKIIACVGLIGSGKNTVADYIVEKFHYRPMSFANTLKSVVAILFDWDRKLLEGNTEESRKFRETIDPWWTERFGTPVTPRWVLQNFGTNCVRKHFHEDMWILALERQLLKTHENVIITDCRFPNEFKMLEDLNTFFIEVKRGEYPKWVGYAKLQNQGNLPVGTMSTMFPEIHESEWAWIGQDVHVHVDNDRDLPYLFEQVNKIVPYLNL